MVEITVKLPEKVAQSFGNTPETIARRILENVAIEEYRAGRLSQRQAGEMMGFDYWQTESFLTAHHVPLNYGLKDLEADHVILEKLLGTP